jgi:hypothetical protein
MTEGLYDEDVKGIKAVLVMGEILLEKKNQEYNISTWCLSTFIIPLSWIRLHRLVVFLQYALPITSFNTFFLS